MVIKRQLIPMIRGVNPTLARSVDVKRLPRLTLDRLRRYPTTPAFSEHEFARALDRTSRRAWRVAVPFYRRWWLAFLNRHRPIPPQRYPVFSSANCSGADSVPFLEVDDEAGR